MLLLVLALCFVAAHYEPMRVIIRRFDGTVQDAIVLAEIGPALRLAIPGAEDAVEYRAADGVWIGEDGEPALIEFGVGTGRWELVPAPALPLASPGLKPLARGIRQYVN